MLCAAGLFLQSVGIIILNHLKIPTVQTVLKYPSVLCSVRKKGHHVQYVAFEKMLQRLHNGSAET